MDLLQVKVICRVSQFCEKANLFMVISSKKSKVYSFLSFSLVYISLIYSITIANAQIEWS